MEMEEHFPLTTKIRDGRRVFGYWSVIGSPMVLERLGPLGYDYLVVDEQHGVAAHRGALEDLIAIRAGGGEGLVRVAANDPVRIGIALDAGASGVIVPWVETADEARRAVAAKNYPPEGVRSFGPLRGDRSRTAAPADLNAGILCLAMVETRTGLDNVEEITAVDGLDGVYVGPSDLRLALGGRRHDDADRAEELEDAVARILHAAHASGKVAGIHTPNGAMARRRAEQGFDIVTIASDYNHLINAASEHLATATDPDGGP